MSVRDLCHAIESEFKVERERCEADALAFLEGLIKDGLVQVVTPSPGDN